MICILWFFANLATISQSSFKVERIFNLIYDVTIILPKMIMSYQPSKIWQAYYNFLGNLTAISQFSCKVVRIFNLICDVTIILPKNDNELSTIKNLTCILWLFCKPDSHLTIQLQSSYHTILVLHWWKNIYFNLWCYHNPIEEW
jgi:hypothetical protein